MIYWIHVDVITKSIPTTKANTHTNKPKKVNTEDP